MRKTEDDTWIPTVCISGASWSGIRLTVEEWIALRQNLPRIKKYLEKEDPVQNNVELCSKNNLSVALSRDRRGKHMIILRGNNMGKQKKKKEKKEASISSFNQYLSFKFR